jgi:outer membrane receptor protein involved in Fe transport
MSHRFFALIAVSMAVTVFGPVASSQEDVDGESSYEELPEISFEGEVTVTGSLIPRADLTALSPVAVMEVPTELTYSGTVRIEDLVRTMPQAFAGQNSTIANGATGTASIDLRNLGPRRTLVLINGRRMAFQDFFGADLNAIPAPLVKRLDVLTGGASTVYGSDALAGVVNFIMDTNFSGVRGGLQYSVYNHDNNNDTARRINEEVGFEVPTGMITDGDAINANVALGGSFADGKGHAVAYIDYRTIDSLTKAARDYFNCTVLESPDGPYCGGSTTSAMGRFIAFKPDGSFHGDYVLHWVEDGGDGHSFRPFMGERFNYGEYNHIQRPDEKFNAGAFANYEINRHFDVYMEVMYMNNYTDAQIAPSGSFWQNDPISCSNPMLSEQQHDILCVQAGYTDDEYADVGVLRRNVEGEPRSNQLGHTDSRLVAGLRGDISDAWSYDLYWLRAESHLQESYVNDLSVERINYALDVIEDPDTGEWICRNEQARANGCVPWNVFQEGAVTQEAVDYITTVGVQYQTTKTEVGNLTFTGDLEPHGVVIPTASEGLQVAIGAEYRSQHLRLVPDEVYETGDAAGFIGHSITLAAGYNVRELFLEALLPVVQDVRGARDLALELGYRYSDYYQTSGGFNTYKILANWAINDSWRLRGGYNRAVREPSLTELYEPLLEWGSGYIDLCEGEVPVESFERCARTGVTEEQYGNIPILWEPFPGSNALYGGNPNLNPETGDTYTAGLVWTPKSIHGLSVTLDYYRIEISDAIAELPAETVHRVCMDTGDPAYCSLIHRDARGSIASWNFEGYTDLTRQNVGGETAEGIDVNANYLIGLGNAGFLATDLMGSYMLARGLESPEFSFECVGYFGFQCGQPKSIWRHRLRATWETAFRLNLSLGWRYLGPADNDDASSNPDLGDPEYMEIWRINGSDRIRPYNWFDLAASYTMRNGLKFTLGVNNILDEEPPFLPGMADGWGINLYGNYDPLGRYVFGSVQFNF